jgi:hypothetical protein
MIAGIDRILPFVVVTLLASKPCTEWFVNDSKSRKVQMRSTVLRILMAVLLSLVVIRLPLSVANNSRIAMPNGLCSLYKESISELPITII